MRTRNTTTAMFLFLVLAALCVEAQPTYFMIGCDNMHHRVDEWMGIRDSSHMPFAAFARARSLGLNTAMLHPVDSAGMSYSALVTKLVNSAHAVEMRTIIHDDSLRQLTAGERRIYQAEETVDFSSRSQDVSVIADPDFNDGHNFDLLAEKRDKLPRPANIIELAPGFTQTGRVLSGFEHERELHRDSIIYYFSIKMRLAGTNSLDLNDEVVRLVFRFNNSSIDTTLYGYDFHDGNDFIMDVRELFLGSFYIDSSDASGFHFYRVYEPQNAGAAFPLEPRSKELSDRFTISNSCNIEIEVYYFGHGVVHIDQINLSDFEGWGMFMGDEHSALGETISRTTSLSSFSQ